MHIGIDKRDIRGILFFRLVFFEQNAIVHNKVGREVGEAAVLRGNKK